MYGVIVVDAESIGLLVSDMMPICMIIALHIIMTLRGSINCSTVICSPTVILAILREASSEHYGPRVYSTPYFQPYCLKGLTTPLKRWVQALLCLRRYSGLDEILLLD